MAERKPLISVLLGAGASADAGIPTTREMTEAIIERVQGLTHRRLLEFVRHTLAADAAVRGSADVGVDVERLFAAVELLIARREQPWSPFVSNWSPGLESFSSGPPLHEGDLAWDLRDFDRTVNDVLSGRSSRHSFHTPGRQLARGLARTLARSQDNDVSSLLERVREEMLQSLFEVLRLDDPAQTEYLNPLLRLARRQGSLTIATLNYDVSVEELARRQKVRCDTGIETWLERGELDWPERGLRLLKLHGSIDWVMEQRWEEGQLPLQRLKTVSLTEEDAGHSRPAVVFGEAGKLRSEGPYTELLLAWSAQLRKADRLLVIGYSFRDQHVNEMIARWFNAAPQRRIFLVDPAPEPRAGSDFAQQLAYVDPPGGSDSVSSPRFRHFPTSAQEGLAEAVQEAGKPR